MTDSWPLVPLEKLGKWIGGGTPSKRKPEYWTNGTVPWLSPKDMGADVLTDVQDRITELAVEESSTKVVPAGSVAIVMRSGILERTAPVAVVPFATALNQDIKALVPTEDVSPRWVAWMLRAREEEVLSAARKAGTTVASLEFSRLKAITIPIPPLQEQLRVLGILEDQLSRLDAAETYLRNALMHLEGYRRAQLEKLPPSDAPRVALGLLATASGYGTSAKCVVDGAGVPVVRIPNLRDGAIDLTHEKRIQDPHTNVESLMLNDGDLLIVRTNGSRSLIGRSAVVRQGLSASFASYLIRYVLDSERVDPAWAHLMLERPSARRAIEEMAASSAGQHNLSLQKLDQVDIPVPPIDLQRELRLKHDEVAIERTRLINMIALQRTRAASLRRSLLTAAGSGRLTGS